MARFFIVVVLILIAGFFLLSFFLPGKEFIIDFKKDSSIVIFAVGDIMLNRGVEYMVEEEGGKDFKYPFLRIKDYLDKSDILFGNLEGPISDKGEKVGSIYSFRADPKAVEGLVFAGFDILSLANNHILDYQKTALEDTISILEENGIIYTGAGVLAEEAFSLKIIESKGVKIGFFSYTNLGSETWKNIGVAWVSEEDFKKVKEDISSAKEKVDVLIVSLHAGEEYQEEPTDFQKSFSEMAIDAGANLVLGHHPHVVQRVEKYNSGWIAYSLGNFVFDQGFSEETKEGLLLEVVIKNGKIKKVKEVKIKISDTFQPYL
ncbi:MAG: CapA family protein [Candidatus Nealsonbacteria bacterium]